MSYYITNLCRWCRFAVRWMIRYVIMQAFYVYKIHRAHIAMRCQAIDLGTQIYKSLCFWVQTIVFDDH